MCVQPRDLLRYVMSPREAGKRQSQSTKPPDDPIDRSIAYGNYLSNWVATLIMVQSKARMRLKAIEHFIRLAIALRELDNFDCLSKSLSAPFEWFWDTE